MGAIELVRRARSVRFRTLLAGALLGSLLLVLGALPGRLEGRRTAQDAWIPLRALTAAEAALLLSDPEKGTAIVRLDESELELATRRYLVRLGPEDPPPGESLDVREAEGVRYAITSATWEPTSLLYRLDRGAVENALGRKLSAGDVDASFLDRYRVTFRPELVPLYVVVETLALALWSATALFLLLRNRRLTLVLPIWSGAVMMLGLFVVAYSPAFFDADWFHQRIVVEDLLVGTLWLPLAWSPPLGATLLSLALYAVLRSAEWHAHLRGRPIAGHRAKALALTAAIAGVFFAWQALQYARETARCDAQLDEALARGRDLELGWLPDVASRRADYDTALLDDAVIPSEQRQAIRALLRRVPDASHDLRILVATSRGSVFPGRFLFLWGGDTREPYADLRTVGDDAQTRLIDEDEVRKILEGTGRLRTGFVRFLQGRHVCGERTVASGSVAAYVVSEARFASRVPLILSAF